MKELSARILVAEDEESMRLFLKRMLTREGFDVVVAADGKLAQEILKREDFDLLLTDIRMPKLEGIDLLLWAKEQNRKMPVIVMTGYGSIPSAIEALKSGAENYVTKPFEKVEILKIVRGALEKGRLETENKRLKRLLDDGRSFGHLIGSAPAMRTLYDQIDAVAPKRGTVLIQGESGTGKELVARSIHKRSGYGDGPFVAVHLGAVPKDLVAAELFGVVKGAFTGARSDRDGAVERASGGTLFLDEIGDAPSEVQTALLRFLEDGEVSPVGGSTSRVVDTRIVVATNRPLVELVDQGLFRQDLYFRLHVFALEVPPLRRRKEDVADLVQHFLALHGKGKQEVSLALSAQLQSYDWPGNVRELENVVERMVAMSPAGVLEQAYLPKEIANPDPGSQGSHSMTFKESQSVFEREFIEDLLRRHGGNVSAAARAAEMSRPTLHAKIQAHRIDLDRFR